MNDTTRRPTFAEISLANDLRKLDEDWLLLEHVAVRKALFAPDDPKTRYALLGQFRIQTRKTREALLFGGMPFDTALVICRMLEAAFHVARRHVNGIDPDEPIAYQLTETVPAGDIVALSSSPLVTREAVDEVPC